MKFTIDRVEVKERTKTRIEWHVTIGDEPNIWIYQRQAEAIGKVEMELDRLEGAENGGK